MALYLEAVFHPFDACSCVTPSRFFDRAPASVARDRGDVAALVLDDDFAPRAVVRSAVELPATLFAMTTRANAAGDGPPLDAEGLAVVLHRCGRVVLLVLPVEL